MRIYVSQATIDRWLTSGRVRLDGDLVRLDASGTPSCLFINPAVFFEEYADGSGADPCQVVGCVKSSQELAQMGADHIDNAVLLGEHGYTVKPGYVAVPVGADGLETRLDPESWTRLVALFNELAG